MTFFLTLFLTLFLDGDATMTSKFEDFEQDQSVGNLNSELADSSDRFELLSAYVDGELSPSQRHQVQAWIDQDPQVKAVYNQLSTLQRQIQALKAPSSQKTVQEIANQVFETVANRRRQHRLRLGLSAIAVSCLATITSLIPGVIPSFKMAQSIDGNFNSVSQLNSSQARLDSQPQEPHAVMLAVALNKPAINIPKAATESNFEPTPSRKNQI